MASVSANDQPAGTMLPVGVSIVLHRTPVSRIESLLRDLLAEGVQRIYLIDNSPPTFEPFAGWIQPERVVTLRTGSNLGFGRAHNIVLPESVREHRYHLVCNPDVRIEAGAMTRLCQFMDTHQHVGLCMPRIVNPAGETQYLCKRPPTPVDILLRTFAPHGWFAARHAWYETRDQSYDLVRPAQCLSGCFMLFRSSLLELLGGFDERFFLYFEDFDISRRAGIHAQNFYFPEARVVHEHARRHGSSLRLFFLAMQSAVRYFNKWGWFEHAGAAGARTTGDRA